MKKIIKQGLMIGIANLLVWFLLSQVLNLLIPSLAKEYQNNSLFRPWTDPLMMTFFLYPFILGFVLAYFWNTFGNQFQGKTRAQKALNFTKFYFLIATVPGMFVSYTSFQVSALMIVSWTLAGLLETFVAGYILVSSK